MQSHFIDILHLIENIFRLVRIIKTTKHFGINDEIIRKKKWILTLWIFCHDSS